MTPADLVSRCAKLWPWTIRDEAGAAAWLEVYSNALGHLEPQELADAWASYIAKTDKREPPLPAAILAHVRPKFGSLQPGAKTMRGMSDYLRTAIPDLVAAWWQDNGAWFQQQLQLRPGIDAAQARTLLDRWLRDDANLLAQNVYWGRAAEGAKLQASARTIANSLGREGPRSAPAAPAPASSSTGGNVASMSDAARRIVAQTMQTPCDVEG